MSSRRGVEVRAQMVASVLRVAVAPGAVVAEDDVLLVVESMKMEIPVTAPAAGVVTAVPVAAGDVVELGDVLAVLDAGGAA